MLHLYYFLNNCGPSNAASSKQKKPSEEFLRQAQRSLLITAGVFLTCTAPCGLATYKDKAEAFEIGSQ